MRLISASTLSRLLKPKEGALGRLVGMGESSGFVKGESDRPARLSLGSFGPGCLPRLKARAWAPFDDPVVADVWVLLPREIELLRD